MVGTKLRYALFTVLFLFISGLAANDTGNILEVNINKDDLEVDMASVKSWSRNSQTFYGFGALSCYDKDDIHNTLYNVTLTQVGYTDIKGVGFGIGLRGVFGLLNSAVNPYGEDKEKEVGALGLRMKLTYTFPVRVKTILGGTYNYAPKSLAFTQDLESYAESRVELSAEPIDGGWVYLGYRSIAFAFENVSETYELNTKAYGGIKIFF